MSSSSQKADYYTTLGIAKSANEAEIKKAFRTLSLKHHPDKVQRKGGTKDDIEAANAKFKEISEAYEVLSDPDKRALYDKYGHQGLANGPPPDAQSDPRFAHFFNAGGAGGAGGGPGGARQFHFQASRPEDIFAQFFGGRSPFGAGGGFGSDDDDGGGMGGMGGGGGDPFAAMFGGGGGGMPGMHGMHGGHGGGGGRSRKPRTVVSEVACTLEELATGGTRKLKVSSNAFDSNGQPTQRSSPVELEIKPGYHAGTKLTFNGLGDQLQPGGPAGDIQFVIAEKPHRWYKRVGADIVYEATISLRAALTGVKITLKDLYGEDVVLTTDTPVQPGDERRIVGHGLPDRKKGGKKGDLVVKFNVRFPTSIPADKLATLKQVLTGL